MKPRHQVSRAAIDLIKRFEGYRRTAAQLPDGRWTIGYGHTLTARQGAEVSESDAEALLLYDLIGVAHTVSELTFTPLAQNQFDALCAFAFNIGLDRFRGSQVLKRINEGALLEAACGMELWRRAEFEGEAIVIDGLVRRRALEKALFLTPADGAFPPAPSALLRPQLDSSAAPLVPAERPTVVTAPMSGEVATLALDGPAPEPAFDTAAAAAEAVRVRLATLFKDEPAADPTPDAADEARPQADFAPPITVEAPNEIPSDEPAPEREAWKQTPFELTGEAPEPPAPPPRDPEPEHPGPPSLDLFEPPPPRDPLDEELAGYVAFPPRAYDVATPRPAAAPREGYLSLVSLAVLGLAFFAGGLFWALNAQGGAEPGWLTPKVVGGLACVAGVGFFSIALFLLLQRLGEAAERAHERPPSRPRR
ncbi:glycoside hydrolase family protein [Phenylobacterium sp.]|jgi:lysozyme|uniref:glycoside hydrolase family protein n=1 Tax=Phenylobacterium sp. TaxID=1871053 RepID=UPI0037845FAF